jgi:hypothetical protein
LTLVEAVIVGLSGPILLLGLAAWRAICEARRSTRRRIPARQFVPVPPQHYNCRCRLELKPTEVRKATEQAAQIARELQLDMMERERRQAGGTLDEYLAFTKFARSAGCEGLPRTVDQLGSQSKPTNSHSPDVGISVAGPSIPRAVPGLLGPSVPLDTVNCVEDFQFPADARIVDVDRQGIALANEIYAAIKDDWNAHRSNESRLDRALSRTDDRYAWAAGEGEKEPEPPSRFEYRRKFEP